MWTQGRRRNTGPDAGLFWQRLVDEYGLRPVARAAGADAKSVKRWMSGRCLATTATIEYTIDRLLPLNVGAHPIYSPSMAIDGETRVLFVGQYTIGSARGGNSVRTL